MGLLEGDGTISTDLIEGRRMRIRVIISLKNSKGNKEMLLLLSNLIIGCRVREERNNRYISLIIDNKKSISNAFKIFEKYGFLTKRKRAQYILAKKILDGLVKIEEFLELRKNKYKNIDIFLKNKNLIKSEYFNG